MADPKRKLMFDRGKGLGKLKLRFDEGELSIEISKHRSAHKLSREEAQELALWLSAWSLRLIENAAKSAPAEVSEPDAGPKPEASEARRAGKQQRKAEKRKDKARDEVKDAKRREQDLPLARRGDEPPLVLTDAERAN